VADEGWRARPRSQWHLNAEGIGGWRAEKALNFVRRQPDRWRRILHHLARQGPPAKNATMKDRSPSTRGTGNGMDIMGAPVIELEFSADRPVAFVAARLNDVAWRVSRVITSHRDATKPRARSSPASATG
jgi:hypothetical protein